MLLHALCPADVFRVTNQYSETFTPNSAITRAMFNEGCKNLGFKDPYVTGRVWVRENMSGEPDFGWTTGVLALRREVTYEGSLFVNLRLFGGAGAPASAGTLLTFGMLSFGYRGRQFTVNGKEFGEFEMIGNGVGSHININVEVEFSPGAAIIYLNNVEAYRQELPSGLKPSYVELQGETNIGFRHLIIYDSSGDELNERQGRMRLRSISMSQDLSSTDMTRVGSANGLAADLAKIPLDFEGREVFRGNGASSFADGGYAYGNKVGQFVKSGFVMPDVGFMVYKGALLNTVARKEEEGNPSLGVSLGGDDASSVKGVGTGKWTYKAHAVTVTDLEFSVSLDLESQISSNVYVPKENGIDVYSSDVELEVVEERSIYNTALTPSNTFLAATDYRYHAYTEFMSKPVATSQNFLDASTIKADNSNMPPT